jgi:hypothetical protein
MHFHTICSMWWAWSLWKQQCLFSTLSLHVIPRHSAFNSWPSCSLCDHSCSFPRTPPDISHSGRCVQGIQKNSAVRGWSADLLSFYNTQQWDHPRNNWWNNHVSVLFICFVPTVSPQPKSHSKLIFQKLNLNLELVKVPCSSSKNWSPVQANFVVNVKIKRVPKRLSNMAQNSEWIMTGMFILLGRDTTVGLLTWKCGRLEVEEQSTVDLSRHRNLCSVLVAKVSTSPGSGSRIFLFWLERL